MIEFIGVTKKYGNTTAIDRISIKIPESGIYCLLGRNGAGKTTFWFGWTNNGVVVAFLRQFAFLFMLASVVHTLAAMQDKWYGWAADLLIIAIISVFTGLVNTAVKEKSRGLQLGLVNISANGISGTEISLVNITNRLDGFQLGLLNYVDTIENGIPAGLISFVRNGGYKAVELSVTEIAPITFAFKTGVRKFYTSLSEFCWVHL